jgi:hypothetical protein
MNPIASSSDKTSFPQLICTNDTNDYCKSRQACYIQIIATEVDMQKLMWKRPSDGTWHWVKTVPAAQAPQTLKWFRDGHPMYEYKLEEAGR